MIQAIAFDNDSGCYQNATEVLREGLRMLEQRDAEDAYRLAVFEKLPKRALLIIDVIRLLQDSMDLAKHLPD